jgi:alginate O-acetyltransferase complex protein AlgJ
MTLKLEYNLSDVLNGKATQQIENKLIEHVPLKKPLTQLWSRLFYSAFTEGKKGVLVGTQGWLCSREEYFRPKYTETNLTQHIQYIKQVHSKLEEQNIELAVILIPEKIDIYSEYMRDKSAHLENDLYGRILDQLSTDSIIIISPREMLKKAKVESPVFFRTDTHWTPFGADKVARYTANLLSHWRGDQDFESVMAVEETFKGDLLNFIPAGDVWVSQQIKADLIAKPITSLLANDSDALFGDEVPLSTAIVGTSFSANKNWGFHGALQLAMSQEILDYSESGKGPFEPMRALISGNELQNLDVTHILWEIPVRYFVQDRNSSEH